jgi:Flp pilus assembly protein TadG
MVKKPLRAVLQRWLSPNQMIQDESGSILPMFGLVTIALFGIIGATLDYERVTDAKSKLAAAADAATLAAARAAADIAKADPDKSSGQVASEAEAVGQKYFETNLASMTSVDFEAPRLSVQRQNGSWVANIEYDAVLATKLASVIGFQSIYIGGKAEASVAPGFPVLDIAMCVDSTGSMTPTLEAVKANALGFYDNLNGELRARDITEFPLVRVRLIYFKDFGDSMPGVWDPDAQRISDYFSLPDQSPDFNAFAAPQMAGGGADWAESGVECLNEAIDTDWIKVGDQPAGYSDVVTNVYPLIVIWTDASSHRVGYPNSLANPDYPAASKMPRTDTAILAKWNSAAKIDQDNKLILFFGDPAQASGEADGGASGWHEVMTWPGFQHAGTVTDGNVSMMEILADGVASKAKALSLSQ